LCPQIHKIERAAKCELTYYLDHLDKPLTEAERERLGRWTNQDADRLVVTQVREAYEQVKRLVGRTNKVISMLQEDLERSDVGLYTGMLDIDPEDRPSVKGYQLEKPIWVQDIEWSEDVYDVLGPMQDRYAKMVKSAGDDIKEILFAVNDRFLLFISI
jgi:hypothetical protein